MPYGSPLPLDNQRTVTHRVVYLPFVSTCPKCGIQRSQRGNRAALQRLLDHGHPIEAFCKVCDEYWPICVRERAEIARAQAE